MVKKGVEDYAREQGYAEIRISSPADDASIRDNAGNVKVDVKLSPELRTGDKVELKLDGQSIGGGKKTAFTLTDMDRGSHSLQALVKNSAGKVVARSASITFTLQRRSKILQPGVQPVQPGVPIVPRRPTNSVPAGGGG